MPTRRRVAIVVDTSASMRRGDLWQQAIAAVDQVDGRAAGRSIKSPCLACDDTLRPLVSFEEMAQSRAGANVGRRQQPTCKTCSRPGPARIWARPDGRRRNRQQRGRSAAISSNVWPAASCSSATCRKAAGSTCWPIIRGPRMCARAEAGEAIAENERRPALVADTDRPTNPPTPRETARARVERRRLGRRSVPARLARRGRQADRRRRCPRTCRPAKAASSACRGPPMQPPQAACS